MADEKKSIFDLADKFGVVSPFGNDWVKEDFNIVSSGNVVITGYWSSDHQGKNKTINAKLGETVYFQLFTKNIPTNKVLRLKLYESDSPFGKTYMYSTSVNILSNGSAKIKLELDINWIKYIKADTGNEIELFWIVEYAKTPFELSSILNVSEDEYLTAIIDDDYRYTCNCGWIDKTHAFGDTKRDRKDIGAKNLWKQVLNETGTKSEWKNGYKVTYTQDVILYGVEIGVTKSYFVKYGLSINIKEQITMSIFQEVSKEFEQKQAYGTLFGKGASSFEPSDLVSNILGLYSVLRPELTKNVILKKCNELDEEKSISVYKKYPGTFTLSEYKNYKFTPRFFDNNYCKNPVFPKEFQEIKPYPKDDENFRDWIDLFDVHKGVPPITNPKW